MIERNAKIESVEITNDDYGVLTTWIGLDYGDGEHQGFGGYALYLPKDFKYHTTQVIPAAGHFIWRVMEIADVTRWSQLPGKIIRVKKESELGKIEAIGHALNDDWFCPSQEFTELSNKINGNKNG